jgi:hypothetical protein
MTSGSGARRRKISSTPGAANVGELSVPAAQLADLRGRLRHTSFALLLLLVPTELALVTADALLRSAGVRVPGVWIPRLPLDLGVPALVLLLALVMSRFLPHGREAAAASPLWGRTRHLPGEPRRASLPALMIATILVGFGGFATVDAYHGVRALNGDGNILVIGRNSQVTNRETSSHGHRTIFIDGLAGQIVTEGGGGRNGDQYGVFPPDANRAWYLGPSGWVIDVLVWALGLIALVAAGVLLWWQVRGAFARRRWLVGLRHRPRTGTRLPVAVAYGRAVTVLAVIGAAIALLSQVVSRDHYATLTVPALAEHGLTTDLTVLGGDNSGPIGTSTTPKPQRAHSVMGDSLALSHDLGMDAEVTRYATGSQALGMQQQYLTSAAKMGIRQRAADGTEIVIFTDPYSSGAQISAAAVRGPLLVTVEVSDVSGRPPAAGEASLVAQGPLVRDVIAENASRIDEVSLPWWGSLSVNLG